MAAAIEEVELLRFGIGGAVLACSVIGGAEACLDGLRQGRLWWGDDDRTGNEAGHVLCKNGQCATSTEQSGDQADHDLVHLSSMHGDARTASPPCPATGQSGPSRAKNQYSANLNGSNRSQCCERVLWCGCNALNAGG